MVDSQGRNFAGQGGTDEVNIGVVPGALFEFDQNWTALAFVRTEGFATEEGTIFAKADIAIMQQRSQFVCRVTAGAEPQAIEVLATNDSQNGFKVIATGGLHIALNVWYLIAVTNDGSGAYKLYTLLAEGGFSPGFSSGFSRQGALDNGVNTATVINNAIDLAAPNSFGRHSSSDELEGDLAFEAYFSETFSLQDIERYRSNPARVVQRKSAAFQSAPPTCEYFLPFGMSTPEADFSANAIKGKILGVPSFSIGDGPPVVTPWHTDHPMGGRL